MTYSLWDIECGKLISRSDDDVPIKDAVRAILGHYGEGVAVEYSMGRVDEDGTILEPLSGAPLIAWAIG